MPIYEYTCQKCNAHTEIMQKMTDKPLTRCRKCRGKLEKIWSQTSMQFKGTGWYVTDYAGKKSGAPENEEKKEDKKGAETAPTVEAKTKKESKDKNKTTSANLTTTAAPTRAASTSDSTRD